MPSSRAREVSRANARIPGVPASVAELAENGQGGISDRLMREVARHDSCFDHPGMERASEDRTAEAARVVVGRRPVRRDIKALVDPGSFREWDSELHSRDPLRFEDTRPYRQRLEQARAKTGEREAFVSGSARIGSHRVAIGVFEFGFLGGGVGCVVGEKLARLFERAVARDLPVVVLHRTGGARMQEGTWSLFQMAKICHAIETHRATEQPYVSVLADPTMGGGLASSGALGDVILAEPGARIGFAGPRVVDQTIGVQLSPGLQTAEMLLENGFVDRIVPPDELHAVLVRLIGLGARSPRAARPTEPSRPLPRVLAPPVERMASVSAARRLTRPRFDAWVGSLCDDFLELHGDRLQSDDPTIRGGLARLGDVSIMLVGIDRGSTQRELGTRNFGMPRPAGYRKAQRLFRLAGKLRLPVVTLVDTPGADPTAEAERHGQAFAIAETIRELTVVDTPVVAVITGEGGSGGALALATADHLIMLEHTHLSVISPEGCSAILWRDPGSRAPAERRGRAARAMAAMRSVARDLVRCGLADEMIQEPQPASHPLDPAVVDATRAAIETALERLTALEPAELQRRRRRRLFRDRRWIGEEPLDPFG